MADQTKHSGDEQMYEYTRFRAKVQLGDGPDQRGEVTVEVVREPNPDGEDEKVNDYRPVYYQLPDGTTAGATLDHRTFAEFYGELDRATDALRENLGLEPEGDNDSPDPDPEEMESV